MMRQSETWDHVPREALREWKTRATIAEQQRDAALARVAELEGLLRAIRYVANDVLMGGSLNAQEQVQLAAVMTPVDPVLWALAQEGQ